MKTNFFVTLLILLLINGKSFTQELVFIVNNSPVDKGAVFSISGEKISFIDSIYTDNSGRFVFKPKEKIDREGLYRFLLSSNKFIDFIFDYNDIEFLTEYNHPADSLIINKSESNKLFYQFLKVNRDYKTKNELLQIILTHYPPYDEYYDLTKERLIKLQNEYLDFINNISQKKPESFIARYIYSSQLPVVELKIPNDQQLNFLKSFALQKVNFDDYDLIYSDVFANKSIEYLTYYRNPQLPLGLLEEEFKKAVDSILTKSSINIFVYQHVADYLVDGFKKFGFNNVVDYIIENYVIKDDLCLDESTESSIQNRINQSKLLSVGTKVPNIILKNENGDEINLNKIESEKILILFYATWCSHCTEMLPEIHKIYKEKGNFEVIAISLDNNREEWIDFIKNYSFDWINVSDLKGWDSKAANDYYIYATPTMFLVDKEKRIISKPLNLIELRNM